MSLDLADYKTQAQKAVKGFWNSRAKARRIQKAAGRADQGSRSEVTAGKNMNGFLDLITDIVRRNGLKNGDICLKRRALTLPGFFRPTKVWDILVLNEGRLVAAIELKSQAGSFGNNFNNRTEEALGTAVDFWTAYREGAFGETPRPFVGWLMLVEDCPASRSPVRDSLAHFHLFEEFSGASYAERYNILCRKLVQEQLYTTASVIVSPRSAARTGAYSELASLTGLSTFVTSLAGHIAAEAAR
jgi:hypothetical protein